MIRNRRLWRIRKVFNMSHLPDMDTDNETDNFLLLIESEWQSYLAENLNVTIIYEKRRKLAKLTNLESGYCFLYSLLFLAGLLANGLAFHVVSTVLFRSGSRHVNILVYIGTLAVVNLIILTFLPVTIIDIVAGEWLLPSVLCPVYWIMETMNKMVSPLVLSCLTVACYCSVCRPEMIRMYRSGWVAALHILGVAAIVAWKGKPFVDHSASFHLVDLVNGSVTVHYGKKCLFHPAEGAELVKSVTIDGFLSIYLLPMFYMMAFYIAILRTIMRQSHNLGRRSPPRHFWKAARSAALLVSFYCLCWTPYWTITLAMVIQNGRPHDEETLNLWSALAFAAHILPLVNCSFSPLIYTMTNGHVRTLYKTAATVKEQRYRLRSRTNSTYSSRLQEEK